jgi:hypothetical protein
MKIVLTKYCEEVTSVKRSVTEVKVQASGRDLEKDEAPLVEGASPINPSRRFPGQHKKGTPFLTALAGAVNDTVDLHSPSSKDSLCQLTYGMAGALKDDSRWKRMVGETAFQLEDEHTRKNCQAPIEHMGDEPSLTNEERLVRYRLSARRFIATQNMTEHQNRLERKLKFEIDF